MYSLIKMHQIHRDASSRIAMSDRVGAERKCVITSLLARSALLIVARAFDWSTWILIPYMAVVALCDCVGDTQRCFISELR